MGKDQTQLPAVRHVRVLFRAYKMFEPLAVGGEQRGRELLALVLDAAEHDEVSGVDFITFALDSKLRGDIPEPWRQTYTNDKE